MYQNQFFFPLCGSTFQTGNNLLHFAGKIHLKFWPVGLRGNKSVHSYACRKL